MSESDYVVLTQSGALCDDEGNLGPDNFEAAIRAQLRLYAQRQLSNAMILGTSTRAELIQLGTLKAVLREHTKLHEDQARRDAAGDTLSMHFETIHRNISDLRDRFQEFSRMGCAYQVSSTDSKSCCGSENEVSLEQHVQEAQALAACLRNMAGIVGNQTLTSSPPAALKVPEVFGGNLRQSPARERKIRALSSLRSTPTCTPNSDGNIPRNLSHEIHASRLGELQVSRDHATSVPQRRMSAPGRLPTIIVGHDKSKEIIRAALRAIHGTSQVLKGYESAKGNSEVEAARGARFVLCQDGSVSQGERSESRSESKFCIADSGNRSSLSRPEANQIGSYKTRRCNWLDYDKWEEVRSWAENAAELVLESDGEVSESSKKGVTAMVMPCGDDLAHQADARSYSEYLPIVRSSDSAGIPNLLKADEDQPYISSSVSQDNGFIHQVPRQTSSPSKLDCSRVQAHQQLSSGIKAVRIKYSRRSSLRKRTATPVSRSEVRNTRGNSLVHPGSAGVEFTDSENIIEGLGGGGEQRL